MFGFVTANLGELTPEQKKRYNAVYCGICRNIRTDASNLCRLTLRYDMAFLALVLMSLYEPEEQTGSRACAIHPLHPRPWVDNVYVRYAADMNLVLAYYNALDDWQDDGKHTGKAMASALEKYLPPLREKFPRQCGAVEKGLRELAGLEAAGCTNPDEPANCFGGLMAEMFVFREDMWQEDLRQMAAALGRFIYFTDAAVDYRRDVRKKKYNPFAAMGIGEDPKRWEQYLVLAMAKCTESYERLPLVQDKALMDNIVYSGVWGNYRRKKSRQEDDHD